MAAIVGSTGLIGTYLRTKLRSCDCYNSRNITSIAGKSYDTVYCAGLPATKWLINKNPENDLENMLVLQSCLSKCEAKRLVLFSTIDVYSVSHSNQTEDVEESSNEPYGKHRYMMEQWVLSNFKSAHIIRLPALFGHGLKKNTLYDLLNNKLELVNPYNIFQWYFLEDLLDDTNMIIKNDIKIANLFSEPIKVSDIIKNVFPDLYVQYKEPVCSIKYDYKTNLSQSGYYKTQKYILDKMAVFVKVYKNARESVVSNLCWKLEDEEDALHLLHRYGIKRLELAVTRYSDWNSIDIQSIQNRFKGFEIYSLQALFYGKDCNVFLETEEYIQHLQTVVKIARKLGAKKLVLGSPANRRVLLHVTDPDFIMVDVLKKCAVDDIDICLEPNATGYNCNYVTTFQEALDIVKKVNHPHVRVNYDTGNAMMMAESVPSDFSLIGHVQVSAPYLKEIAGAEIPEFTYLRKSLEMKEINIDKLEENLNIFLK